jgi:hypothetical protein
MMIIYATLLTLAIELRHFSCHARLAADAAEGCAIDEPYADTYRHCLIFIYFLFSLFSSADFLHITISGYADTPTLIISY